MTKPVRGFLYPILAALLLLASVPSAFAWQQPICNPANGEVRSPESFAQGPNGTKLSDADAEAAYNKFLHEHAGSFPKGAEETCHKPPPTPEPTPDLTPTLEVIVMQPPSAKSTPGPESHGGGSIIWDHFCQWDEQHQFYKVAPTHDLQGAVLNHVDQGLDKAHPDKRTADDGTCAQPTASPAPSPSATPTPVVATAPSPSPEAAPELPAAPEVTVTPTPQVVMVAPPVVVDVPADVPEEEAPSGPRVPAELPVTGDGSCATGCQP